MKIFRHLFVIGVCFIPLIANSQSTVEYQAGAAIEVQAGADVSADNIITNSNYSGGGTFNGGPLPVTMAAMSVQAAKSTATIVWRTESEVENHGFEIERRSVTSSGLGASGSNQHKTLNTQHATEWAKVGFVPGAGTSSFPRDYSFVDQQVTPGRYAYRIKQIDHSGTFTYTSTLEVEIGLAPREFNLSQNYPNPFNPSTAIEFTIPEDGYVTLKVYDLAGKQIATLVDAELTAGIYHQVVFDALKLASGMYVAQLEAKGRQMTKRMVLVK